MKKSKRGLSLSKETVKLLNAEHLASIAGGQSEAGTCLNCSVGCPTYTCTQFFCPATYYNCKRTDINGC